eukprot:CAMPEP_0170344216 /NCGR_PEP_ID=MMETSP0116_2-20130129/73294_1 /TAXON_ID=400756 /ORGANISM="Durinskia baltica, Strain CSIRO CS-38" /LENGTH=62 /DNA_ID=CAMNT_0010597891 /DNA_START=20 /DNA_END=206 /DNA_ORIENTATION=+
MRAAEDLGCRGVVVPVGEDLPGRGRDVPLGGAGLRPHARRGVAHLARPIIRLREAAVEGHRL